MLLHGPCPSSPSCPSRPAQLRAPPRPTEGKGLGPAARLRYRLQWSLNASELANQQGGQRRAALPLAAVPRPRGELRGGPANQRAEPRHGGGGHKRPRGGGGGGGVESRRERVRPWGAEGTGLYRQLSPGSARLGSLSPGSGGALNSEWAVGCGADGGRRPPCPVRALSACR